MKIQYLSDLHLEFDRTCKSAALNKFGDVPDCGADVLVLAGDIDTKLRGVDWAIRQSDHLGIPVVYVLEIMNITERVCRDCWIRLVIVVSTVAFIPWSRANGALQGHVSWVVHFGPILVCTINLACLHMRRQIACRIIARSGLGPPTVGLGQEMRSNSI